MWRLTLDKNLPYQQNPETKRIGVLIVRARSKRIQDLFPAIPSVLQRSREFNHDWWSTGFVDLALEMPVVDSNR
jgi:hypothetical protein